MRPEGACMHAEVSAYTPGERLSTQRTVGPMSQWPRPETLWPKGSERAAAMACCREMLDGAGGWLPAAEYASLLQASEAVDGRAA